MKEWTEPIVLDLSVMNTESAAFPATRHDGTFYDTQYGEFEGGAS